MSVKLMTFLKVHIGQSLKVIEQLRQISEVRQISYITGEYDIMFILEAEKTKDVYRKFVKEIDQIPEIIESSSHLIIKEWENSKIN